MLKKILTLDNRQHARRTSILVVHISVCDLIAKIIYGSCVESH